MKPGMATWSAAIETGIREIDEQHRQLFDLAAGFRGEGDQIRVAKTLAMLADYANTHLRDEEAMLASIAYPGLEAHQALHRQFRQMLRELIDQSRQMSLDSIADRIEELINGWFYNHVLTVDAEYVTAVKSHRGGADSGDRQA